MYVLKVLVFGVKVVGFGWYYFYVLVVVGEKGVECVMVLMVVEIEWDMWLMGCSSID